MAGQQRTWSNLARAFKNFLSDRWSNSAGSPQTIAGCKFYSNMLDMTGDELQAFEQANQGEGWFWDSAVKAWSVEFGETYTADGLARALGAKAPEEPSSSSAPSSSSSSSAPSSSSSGS